MRIKSAAFNNQPPVASFITSPLTPRVGEAVYLRSTSFDPDGKIVSYSWDFGDGSPFSYGEFTKHTYTNPGNYTVTLTVIDDQGLIMTASTTINVLPVQVHDVSVVFVHAEREVAFPGQLISVEVGLANYGVYGETVDVTVFYDSNVAGSVNGISLPPSGRCPPICIVRPSSFPYPTVINISWNTTGVESGNYTLSATVFLTTDENLADNTLVDGQVRILPPPTLTVSPDSGTLGTKVLVQGSGLQSSLFGRMEFGVFVSFDDMFLGLATVRDGAFTFTFDVPHAEPGLHSVNALDQLTGVRATANFTILTTPVSKPLAVTVEVGPIYFPGETAPIYVLVTQDGASTSASRIELTLVKPDDFSGTLDLTLVSPGLYKATYTIAGDNSIGTYVLIARAEAGESQGSALGSFEVKQSWINAAGPTVASIAGIGVVGVLFFGWRSYLRRRDSDDQPSL